VLLPYEFVLFSLYSPLKQYLVLEKAAGKTVPIMPL